ncbi:MAG: recombinase family protein, partial [Clostridia bacterium]|nr:recombinase family protein [Clostridia bacterium]
PELKFSFTRIKYMLKNEVYTGKLIMQKTYTVNPVTKKQRENNGEVPMYVVDAHHEPIIDAAAFEAVQTEYKRRAELGAVWNKHINTSPLTGMIKCGCCCGSYIKDTRYSSNGKKQIFWVCKKRTHGNAAECKGRRVPDRIIKGKFVEAYGKECEETEIAELVSEIVISVDDTIEFHFKDGGVASVEWELTGNKDYWTDEKRLKRSEYTRSHPINNGHLNCFTSKIQCGVCGENFRRHRIGSTGAYGWGCSTGKRICGIRWMREDELKRVICRELYMTEFDETIFTEQVDRLVVFSNSELTVFFKNGTEKTVPWDPKRRRSNAEKSKDNTADNR